MPDTYRDRAGFGVTLESPAGNFSLLWGGCIGVLSPVRAVAEASDIGGDGGVGVSETVSVVETDFVSGGVVTSGEEAVDLGDVAKGSNEGVLGAV